MPNLLEDKKGLLAHILATLHERNSQGPVFPQGLAAAKATSAVLFLLSQQFNRNGRSREACLVFNKRSARVRQPGDLCFPGGSLASRLDPLLSRLLRLPFSPLTRWPYWDYWRRRRGREARRLALVLASGLREAVEEMRLNPFGVKFLGPMVPHRLEIFGRVVYPMVTWITLQARFLTNWEVERIVTIPLGSLLKQAHYACYRIRFKMNQTDGSGDVTEDFPCFRDEEEGVILWGVTYEMVMSFLELIFEFHAPDLASLPVVHASLDESYLQGARIEADTPVPGFRHGPSARHGAGGRRLS